MKKKESLQWFAVYTRARWEKQVSLLFERQGYHHYLPLYKSIRIWSDRKKTVMIPLFPSYVFIKTTPSMFYDILSVPGVVKIISFEGQPVCIPNNQIETIKLLLSKDVDIETTNINPNPGDTIEITKGSLKGLKGDLVEYRGKKKIAIRLDSIDKSVILNIPLSYAKILKKRNN